jgi:hypothetical protein
MKPMVNRELGLVSAAQRFAGSKFNIAPAPTPPQSDDFMKARRVCACLLILFGIQILPVN